tara:strand:+ start:72 stop:221 length:150 start_codon:yes stop_codon:yes gene_type:complete
MISDDIVYSTESDEHLINTGKKQEEQWCYITTEEVNQDIMDSWDIYHYE